MDIGTLLVLLLLLFAINSLVRNQLVASTEELRMNIADQAKELLMSDHLGEEEKSNVRTACEVSFFTNCMFFVAITLPFFFAYAVLFDRKLFEDDSVHIEDAQTRENYKRVRTLALFSAMTFSPFFSVIVLAETVVLRTLYKLFSQPIRDATPPLVIRAEEWIQNSSSRFAHSH